MQQHNGETRNSKTITIWNKWCLYPESFVMAFSVLYASMIFNGFLLSPTLSLNALFPLGLSAHSNGSADFDLIQNPNQIWSIAINSFNHSFRTFVQCLMCSAIRKTSNRNISCSLLQFQFHFNNYYIRRLDRNWKCVALCCAPHSYMTNMAFVWPELI